MYPEIFSYYNQLKDCFYQFDLISMVDHKKSPVVQSPFFFYMFFYFEGEKKVKRAITLL